MFAHGVVLEQVGWIPEEKNAGRSRSDLLDELKAFRVQLRGDVAQSCDVTPGLARLFTSPLLSGNETAAITIGTVVVASLAAVTARVDTATMMSG
jgi:hypothetical protein